MLELIKIHFLIFHYAIFITTCRGFSNKSYTSDSTHFMKYSHLMWYYKCTCPALSTDKELQKVVENSDGYGKPTYDDSESKCSCTRSWVEKGSKEACEGCAAKYPHTGENKFLFINSCYCNGCSESEAEAAMNQMALREDDSEDEFIYDCHIAQKPEDYCLCVTYSARRGSELAGCTSNLGWWPCPSNFDDYKNYDKVQKKLSDYARETDRDLYTKK